MTILKVDPGAAWLVVPTGRPLLPGPLAAATISPVDGRTTTSDVGVLVVLPCSTASATDCAVASRVTTSGLPSTAGEVKRSRLDFLPAASVPTAWMVRPGVPRSRPS